jgi:hypothetical protein
MQESRTDNLGNYNAVFCILISVILYVVTDVSKKPASYIIELKVEGKFSPKLR